MASDNKQKSLPRRCSYCNARFNDDLRELLEEDDEPVYCELCGTEVKIHPTNESQPHKKGNKRKQKPTKSKTKRRKSRQKLTEQPQQLNPITHIGFDPEFPLIFKENLMLVLSRITYLAIKKLDDIEALKNSKRDISKELLDQLEHILEPTTWAKILVNFLGKLHKITIDQFYGHLKRLQKKIRENEQYHEHFIIFLRYIINNTFRIISEMWDAPEIPKFFHVIRKDLKNYGFDAYTKDQKIEKGEQSEASEEADEKELENERESNEFKDIFTRKIADDDPLWRVRAYVIGFLLADGNISKKRITITQNQKDLDLLIISQMALGGNIRPSKEEGYRLTVFGQEIINIVKKYGMVERHSKKEVAIHLEIPKFVLMEINSETLVKDFIRGFYDGDGWFVDTTSNVMMFAMNGSQKFLNSFKEKILLEIPDLSIKIYPSYRRVYIKESHKFFVYSKNIVYIPGQGYRKLNIDDLEKGKIVREKHPWLKKIHISGKYNCINFFNWLYSDNDFYDKFKINGIHICGKRKFHKALRAIGDYNERKEYLAPNWKDSLRIVIQDLQNRFYSSKELKKLTNSALMKMLKNLRLSKLYDKNKIENVSDFNREIKKIELLEGQIHCFQTRIGRSNVNKYFSTTYDLPEIPSGFYRRINLISRNGIPKKCLKNLMIYTFMVNKLNLTYIELIENIMNSNVFHLSTFRPNRILLDIAELKNFEILIEDNSEKDIEEQSFFLNASILPSYFNMELIGLKKQLENLFVN